MTFETIIDASRDGYTLWWAPAIPLVFTLLAAAIVFGMPGVRRLKRGPTDAIVLVLAASITLVVFVATFTTHRLAVGSLRDGTFAVAEGQVTHVAVLPRTYVLHETVTFDVGGRRFVHVAYGVGSHLPIRDGSYARVAYSGDEILRLEVAR